MPYEQEFEGFYCMIYILLHEYRAVDCGRNTTVPVWARVGVNSVQVTPSAAMMGATDGHRL